MLSLEEAKAHIEYYKLAHPNHYNDIGGDKITESKIEQALAITTAIAGGLPTPEDEIFVKELTRICNDAD